MRRLLMLAALLTGMACAEPYTGTINITVNGQTYYNGSWHYDDQTGQLYFTEQPTYQQPAYYYPPTPSKPVASTENWNSSIDRGGPPEDTQVYQPEVQYGGHRRNRRWR